MGNSLHNKIQLGRSSPLASRKVQTVLGLGMSLTIAIIWLAISSFR